MSQSFSSSAFVAPQRPPQAIPATLLSPLYDSLLIGGLSIIALILYWMFVDPGASIYSVSMTAFTFSFLVNMPHFATSYQLLYGDYRKWIFQKPSFFWAAVVAPILIVSVLVYGIQKHQIQILSFLLQGMYLSVGWHYVKQIYGTAIVTSAIQKRYFSNWEKTFILLNLYSVWAMSWVNSNLTTTVATSDGISYYGLGLSPVLLQVCYCFTGLTLTLALGTGLMKYFKTGSRPAASSLVCFLTIYLWYIPALYHPAFFYFVPLFHSLQYLLFMGTLKWNQAQNLAEKMEDPTQKRLTFFRVFWGFFALGIILGGLAMYVIPKSLDTYFPIIQPGMGSTLWFFCFNIFINLHHYFIDNVIWRGDNPFVKTFLVQASQTRPSATSPSEIF